MTKKQKKLKQMRMLAQIFFVIALILFGFSLGTRYRELPNLFQDFKLTKLAPTKETISAKELKGQLEGKDFTLINVHTPYEGEIEKTDTFIPYDEMISNKNSLPKDMSARIILYCKSGRMSEDALRTLKNMGYTSVSHLKGGMDAWKESGYDVLNLANLPEQVLPDSGFELPINWGDMGPKLISLGVIDKAKFEKLIQPTEEQKEILNKKTDKAIKIDIDSAQFVVDMLWAFGLAQKSVVYEEGPMGREYKAKVGNFASTGGWSLAKGSAVNYLNKYNLIDLSPDEQKKVAEISKHVFRPCCGNSTWFPDCNHGMAALAAIELMVDKGLSDEEIYKNVLKLNSFWFPQHYQMIATYFARQGVPWEKVDAKLVLGESYSSGQAASKIYKKVGPLPYEEKQSGGGCGA